MADEVFCQESSGGCDCVLGKHEGIHQCPCGFEWLTRTVCGHDPDLVCAECVEEPMEVS